jgi:hypothetical protein
VVLGALVVELTTSVGAEAVESSPQPVASAAVISSAAPAVRTRRVEPVMSRPFLTHHREVGQGEAPPGSENR